MQYASRDAEIQCWREPYMNGFLRHALGIHDHTTYGGLEPCGRQKGSECSLLAASHQSTTGVASAARVNGDVYAQAMCH